MQGNCLVLVYKKCIYKNIVLRESCGGGGGRGQRGFAMGAISKGSKIIANKNNMGAAFSS